MTHFPCRMAVVLGALLPALSTFAQEAAHLPPANGSPFASRGADLYRASAAASRPVPLAARALKDDPARTWRDHMTAGVHRDDEGDGCLLSFTLGGELDIRGYKGMRLFGATRTLSPPRKGVR